VVDNVISSVLEVTSLKEYEILSKGINLLFIV
jgi:hypothetical protein